MSEVKAAGLDWRRAKWVDEGVERVMGALLQSGVIISGLVVLAGGVLYVLRYAHAAIQYGSFVPERESLRSLRAVVKDALHGDARAISYAVFCLQKKKPCARVIFSIVASS